MDENKKKQKTLVEGLWDLLASVKLAVINFAAISATSIVGTIIEQGAGREKNMALIAKFVGESMAPQTYSLLYAMGFMDMYRSWWFVGLLMIFAINLIICSFERIPPAWRAATEKMKPLNEKQFAGFPIKRELTLEGSPEDNRARITRAMRSAGFSRPTEAVDAGGYQLLSARQAYARLGVYVTHLSILIILIGAVAGVMLGFKGSVYLMEGESTAVAFRNYPINDEQQMAADALLRSRGDIEMAAAEFDLPPERFERRLNEIGMASLGFVLRCVDSGVEFYPQSYSPKEYTSDLRVVEAGMGDVLNKRIEVNDPLRHRGFTFYQSSHGVQARAMRQDTTGMMHFAPYEPSDLVEFRFTVTTAGGKSHKATAQFGKPFELPGTGMTATVRSFIPSYGSGQRQQGSMSNLVVALEITDSKGGTYTYNAAKRFSQPPMSNGATIMVDDVWGIEYTGLQVRRDPGVWIVYLGCAMMAVGLYMAFFMSHRRLWVRVAEGGGKSTLRIAGTAHKHREAFQRKVDKALGQLTEGGN